MQLHARYTLFIVVATIFLLGFSSSAYAAYFTLEPSSKTVRKGEQFDVNVKINTEGEAPKTVEAVILYDESQLRIASIKEPSDSEKFFPLFFKKIMNNKVNMGASINPGAADGKSGEGLIGTIVFEGVLESSNVVNFLCQPGDTRDSNINVKKGARPTDIIECSKLNEATFIVSGVGGSATPTPRPTGDIIPTRIPSPRSSITPTGRITPSITPTRTISPSITITPSIAPVATASATPSPVSISPTPSGLPATGILRTTGTAIGVGILLVVISIIVKVLIL